MAVQLSTSIVTSYSSGYPGRAILNARSHYFVVDSPLAFAGPNEEVNPLELLVASLASCACFVCEKAARELNIPLETSRADASADFDLRAMLGETDDGAVQMFRLSLTFSGPTLEQAEQLVEAFRQRCPVYQTLAKAAPVEIDITII